MTNESEEEIGVKMTKYGKRYRPDWADADEHLVVFPRDERHREDGRYIFRDVWLLNDANEIARLKTCEYATKGEDGSKVWTRCKEGGFDAAPYEVI